MTEDKVNIVYLKGPAAVELVRYRMQCISNLISAWEHTNVYQEYRDVRDARDYLKRQLYNCCLDLGHDDAMFDIELTGGPPYKISIVPVNAEGEAFLKEYEQIEIEQELSRE